MALQKLKIEKIKFRKFFLGFKHTFIAVTQANVLEKQARMKIYAQYPVDLPHIFENHGILGFGHDKILFADFDNFNEKFVGPLTNILEKSTLYQPEISQKIDVHDPNSIKKFLATPEMQAIISNYEDQLVKQGQEIEGLKTLMIHQVDESNKLIERGREELEMHKNNLQYVNEQLSSSKKMSEELERSYADYRQQQAEEMKRVTDQLYEQEKNSRQFQEMIQQKENQIGLLGNRIEELARARQAAVDNSRESSKSMWGRTLIGLVEKIGLAFIVKFLT